MALVMLSMYILLHIGKHKKYKKRSYGDEKTALRNGDNK